jgi:putative colanic acid biosynthesis acetyltransferase WcaF
MPDLLTQPGKAIAAPYSGQRPIDLSQYTSGNFDRGASRFKEALWVLVKCAFFLNPLPLPSKLRCTLLRLFGATIGKGVVIRSRTNITFPWRLSIGDHSWIGEQVEILSLAPVQIGSHVCVSQCAYLCTGSHDFRSPRFNLITRPITIEDHSWVAANAFICPGVTIGERTMVGAGVTVTSNIPAGVRLLPAEPRIEIH